MSSPAAPCASLVGGRWSGAAHVAALASLACSFFSIALMQILLGLAVVAWAWDRWRVRRPAPPLPLLVPFALYLAVSVVSGARAGGLVEGLDVMGEALSPLFFFVAVDLFAPRPRLIRALRAVALFGALAAAGSLAVAAAAAADLREAGTPQHYMTYSGLLMMSLAVALALGARASLRERAALALGILAMGAAILLTLTRGAWLGSLAAALVVLAGWRPRWLLALPVVVLLAYVLAPSVVQERVRSVADLQDRTWQERLFMWRAGVGMVEDHPLLGVGPKRIDEAYPRYQLEGDPREHPNPPGHLHDNVVNIAAERGLLGLGAWLAIWLAYALRLARVWRRAPPGDALLRTTCLASLAAMVAFQVMGVFEFNYGDSEVATYALFLMALPFAAAWGAESAVRDDASGAPPRTAGAAP